MRLDPNSPDPDAFYESIVQANEGLPPEDSLQFTLRLCLLIANQVGDQWVLMAAVAEAARPATAQETTP